MVTSKVVVILHAFFMQRRVCYLFDRIFASQTGSYGIQFVIKETGSVKFRD